MFNKSHLQFLLTAVLLLASPPKLFAATEPKNILAFVDSARQPGRSAIILITVGTTNDGKTDTRKYKLLDSGKEKSIVEFLEPKQRGQKILSTSESLWFYSPRIHKAIKVPTSQRLFGEASLGDIVQLRWLQDYEPRFDEKKEELVDARDCWRLVLEAKSDKASYRKIVLWVAKKDLLPIKANYFLASGKHIKTAEFVAPRIVGNVLVNDHWILREPGADQRYTSVILDDVKLVPLDDQLFTVSQFEQAE